MRDERALHHRRSMWVTVASLWSSLEGSLLFWGCILGLYIAVATFFTRERHREYMPDAIGVWLACAAFFSLLLAGPANPFLTVVSQGDGPGPNPLLQNHVLMVVHPPFLYLGYVGMTIPFGLACAALIKGRLNASLLKPIRESLMRSGGERVAAAVAHRDGRAAFDRGARTPRSAEGLDRHADHLDIPPRRPRHVHDAVGRIQLGPLVHAEREQSSLRRSDVHGAHRDGVPARR